MNEATNRIDIKQFEAALESIGKDLDSDVAGAHEIIASQGFREFLLGSCVHSYKPLSEGRIDAVIATAFTIGFSVGRTYAEMQRLEEMAR